MGRIRPVILIACEMCARTWSPFEDKEVCDMSYVGTHMWKRYHDYDDLLLWAYATDLLRIQNNKDQEHKMM